MFDELLTSLGNYFSNSKNTKKALAISAFLIIILILFTQFFLKGTLKLSSTGIDGQKSFFVSKIEDEPSDNKDPKEYKGSSVSLRLSPGTYRVELVVTDQNDTNKQAKTFKYIEVKARKTKNDSLNAYRANLISIKDTTDKASFVGLNKDSIDLTTVYGVTSIYDIEGDSRETIRKEPSFLNRVVGFCRFDSGGALAINSKGEFFKVVGQTATPMEVAQYATFEQLDYLEQEFYTGINGTSKVSCKSNEALIYGVIRVDDEFAVEFIESDYNSERYRNLVIDDNNGTWFFDKVDTDSLDHDSSIDTELKKTVEYLDNVGNKKNMDIGGYASQIAPLNNSEFCYFYKTKISCANIEEKTQKEIVDLKENREITNLATIDQDRVIYSIGSSVYIHNVKSGESSELYSSEHTVIPYTLEYDNTNNILVFGTQRVVGNKSSYNLPVIKVE